MNAATSRRAPAGSASWSWAQPSAPPGGACYLVGGPVRDTPAGAAGARPRPDHGRPAGGDQAPAAARPAGRRLRRRRPLRHDRAHLPRPRGARPRGWLGRGQGPTSRSPPSAASSTRTGRASRRSPSAPPSRTTWRGGTSPSTPWPRSVGGGALIDPFGGQEDLQRATIRAVGDPDERFRRGPAADAAGGALRRPAGLRDRARDAAMPSGAGPPALERISRERIAEELTRILVSPAPPSGVRLATDLGLMAYAIPEVLPMRGVSQRPLHHKDVFEHTMGVLENIPADQTLRWAALLHDIGKPRTKSVHDGQVHFFGHEDVGERMAAPDPAPAALRRPPRGARGHAGADAPAGQLLRERLDGLGRAAPDARGGGRAGRPDPPLPGRRHQLPPGARAGGQHARGRVRAPLPGAAAAGGRRPPAQPAGRERPDGPLRAAPWALDPAAQGLPAGAGAGGASSTRTTGRRRPSWRGASPPNRVSSSAECEGRISPRVPAGAPSATVGA